MLDKREERSQVSRISATACIRTRTHLLVSISSFVCSEADLQRVFSIMDQAHDFYTLAHLLLYLIKRIPTHYLALLLAIAREVLKQKTHFFLCLKVSLSLLYYSMKEHSLAITCCCSCSTPCG